MNELHLAESRHPDRRSQAAFDALVGLDDQKARLVEELALLLDPGRLAAWQERHHAGGLPIVEALRTSAPLVILSGEVGCGKTALASSVATPVAELLHKPLLCLETPSNVRGAGMVGEVSNRITEVFEIAKSKVSSCKGYGILVIDEADDLATSRAQMQAHHEDRAGLNVLVKQIDQLARGARGLAVILITNRVSVLDPAIRRRVALHLTFERPDTEARRAILASILRGTPASSRDIDELLSETERVPPFSSSDLIHRAAREALNQARRADRPFSAALLRDAIRRIQPTPLVEVPPLE